MLQETTSLPIPTRLALDGLAGSFHSNNIIAFLNHTIPLRPERMSLAKHKFKTRLVQHIFPSPLSEYSVIDRVIHELSRHFSGTSVLIEFVGPDTSQDPKCQ